MMSKKKKPSRVTQNTLNTAKRLLRYMTETYKFFRLESMMG